MKYKWSGRRIRNTVKEQNKIKKIFTAIGKHAPKYIDVMDTSVKKK